MEYSVDWANKKKFQIYEIGSKKIKSILPTEDAFYEFFDGLPNKIHSFYLEWGGGDTFKLLALRYNHKVFCVSGKKVKEYQEKLGIKKTDKNDAKTIGKLVKKYSDNFYEFKEDDRQTLRIGILSKELDKVTKDSTRKKNQLIAFKRRMELLIEKSEVAKIIKQRKDTIESLEKQIKLLKRLLKKALGKHPLWIHYLKEQKGIGEVAAGKIIGSIKRFSRFPNRYALRHFAGMITKKDNHSYNRQLKQALYIFTEQIIKQKIRPWRNIYDSRKKDYKKKHPKWSDGKINAFTKKFVQTQFLDTLLEMGKDIESD